MGKVSDFIIGDEYMLDWKYKLENEGEQLRKILNSEKTIDTIIELYKQMIVCLQSLKEKLKTNDKIKWEYDINSMIENLEIDCPNAKTVCDYFIEEENLNLYLKNFYNLCDDARVWLGI